MKRFLKKVITVFAVAIMAISLMPITQTNAAIKLSTTKKTVYVGDVFTLKVSGTSNKAKWSSSNKNIATVTSKGKVTAKQTGSATVSVKVGKKTLKCKVTVKENINKLVYEDSYIRVYFTGIKKGEYENFLNAGLVIENLSNYKMMVSDEDTSVNGIMARDALAVEIMPGKKAVTTFDLWDDSVDSIQKNEIESIETKFRVWNEDSEDDSYYLTDTVELIK